MAWRGVAWRGVAWRRGPWGGAGLEGWGLCANFKIAVLDVPRYQPTSSGSSPSESSAALRLLPSLLFSFAECLGILGLDSALLHSAPGSACRGEVGF